MLLVLQKFLLKAKKLLSRFVLIMLDSWYLYFIHLCEIHLVSIDTIFIFKFLNKKANLIFCLGLFPILRGGEGLSHD